MRWTPNSVRPSIQFFLINTLHETSSKSVASRILNSKIDFCVQIGQSFWSQAVVEQILRSVTPPQKKNLKDNPLNINEGLNRRLPLHCTYGTRQRNCIYRTCKEFNQLEHMAIPFIPLMKNLTEGDGGVELNKIRIPIIYSRDMALIRFFWTCLYWR